MAGWWASRLSFRLERSENAGTHFSGIWDVDMWVPASAALCALAGMTRVGVNVARYPRWRLPSEDPSTVLSTAAQAGRRQAGSPDAPRQG